MILADTSVWVDHLRAGNPLLEQLLDGDRVLCHPFVIGELALGNLSDRRRTLFFLNRLPRAGIARESEVAHLIEGSRLHGRGIGYVDAHLLASTLLTANALIWSRDRWLAGLAAELGIAASFG